MVEQIVDGVAEAVGIGARTEGAVHYEPVMVGSGRNYVTHVGHGVRHHLAEVVPPTCRRVAIITQAHLGWSVDPGREHRIFDVPDGEAAKSLSIVADVCGRLARWGMTRNDIIVTVGGGVVTDLGGFVASVYHRGVRRDPRAHHPPGTDRRRHRRQVWRQSCRGQESRRILLAAECGPL